MGETRPWAKRTDVLPRVVQRGERVADGLESEEDDLGDVQKGVGRALDASLDFLQEEEGSARP